MTERLDLNSPKGPMDGILVSPERMLSVTEVGLTVLKWDFLEDTDPARRVGRMVQQVVDSRLLSASYDHPVVAQYPVYPTNGIKWIKQVLADRGLTTVAQVDIEALTDIQVDGLYPTKRDRTWYPGYKDSLVDKPAVGLLIGGTDVARHLRELKGESDSWSDGIRSVLSRKHIMVDRMDFEAHQGVYADPMVRSTIAAQLAQQDRLHTAESDVDTLSGIAALFSQDILTSVVAAYPLLEPQLSPLLS